MTSDVHKGFADVDRSANVQQLHRFLERAAELPEIQAIKRRLHELLALDAGDTLLDVGCGIGIEACRVAKMRPGVRVLGLDREAMLDAARERSRSMGVSVEWVPGEAEAIPLPDASVDACMTERVLMYLPEPAAGVGEMARVLRPGGRIACFELDYASTVLPGDPKITELIGEVLRTTVGEPRMGRRLSEFMSTAGFQDITVDVVALLPPRPIFEATVASPVRDAITAGTLPADAAGAWLRSLEESSESNGFLCAFMGFIVGGRRPAA